VRFLLVCCSDPIVKVGTIPKSRGFSPETKIFLWLFCLVNLFPWQRGKNAVYYNKKQSPDESET